MNSGYLTVTPLHQRGVPVAPCPVSSITERWIDHTMDQLSRQKGHGVTNRLPPRRWKRGRTQYSGTLLAENRMPSWSSAIPGRASHVSSPRNRCHPEPSDLSRRSPQGGAGSESRDPPNPPVAANRGRGRGSPAVGHSLATVRHDARRASVSQRLSRAHHSPGKSGDPSTRPPGGLARDDSGRDAELGLGGPWVGARRAGGFRTAPGSENGLLHPYPTP